MVLKLISPLPMGILHLRLQIQKVNLKHYLHKFLFFFLSGIIFFTFFFRSSSVVERSAVNRLVVGSNPTCGAKILS